MNIDKLKYIEILQQNQLMRNNNPSTQYSILILANISINTITEILEFVLRRNNINPVIKTGNYDNIIRESINYSNSNMVIVFYDIYKIIDNITYFEDLDEDGILGLKNRIITEIDLIFENLKDCPLVIFNTFTSSYFANSYVNNSKLEYFINELNDYLIKNKVSNIVLLNIEKIISKIGINHSFDFRLYHSSKILYTLYFLKEYTKGVERIIQQNTGKLKKAIIFDCDNTLWKGILGEDGYSNIDMTFSSTEGRYFNKVQQIAVYLSKRGVIVGLCSKNNENDVNDVFLKHPNIVLKDEFIVIKKINWEDKASNLRRIAEELNIGVDSIVFVDDSSFEINLIKQQIPEVATIQVPESIYDYPNFLLSNVLKYFNLTPNKEDIKKTEIYKQQMQRTNQQKNFNTIEDYLKSLEISLTVHLDDKTIVSRVSQLTQKTNQFNLTTRRYTENEILKFIDDKNSYVFCVNVNDKYGDNGLTALCILKKSNKTDVVEIDTFLMSCRIIGRNIEYAFINFIVAWLKMNNVSIINASFIPTKKNSQVEKFYEEMGFILYDEKEGFKQYSIKADEYIMKNVDYININKEIIL